MKENFNVVLTGDFIARFFYGEYRQAVDDIKKVEFRHYDSLDPELKMAYDRAGFRLVEYLKSQGISLEIK